jgi:hypothetical protein
MIPLSTQQTHTHTYTHNQGNSQNNTNTNNNNQIQKTIEKTPPRVIFSNLLIYIEIINQKVAISLKYLLSNLKNKLDYFNKII